MNATTNTPERYTDRYPERVQVMTLPALMAEADRLEELAAPAAPVDALDRLDRMRYDFVVAEFNTRTAGL